MSSSEDPDKIALPRLRLDLDEVDEPVSAGLPSEYAVTDDELADKRGNYIFTVGNVGCGKSTLQNALIARLWTREDIFFEYRSKKGDHRHDKLLNDWVVSLLDGHLPTRTQQGRLQEFTISLAQRKRRPLELNLLEISGEDIKSIVPTLELEERPRINKQLVEYLRTKKSQINKRFIFVSDCEANRRTAQTAHRKELTEDILFNALLRYLLSKEGLSMERISVLFVAAKWDTVDTEFATVAQYFRRYFPQTRAVLQSERCNATYIPFSIGRIERVEIPNASGGAVRYEERITSLDSRYVDVLIQWIYHTFTGTYLTNMPRIGYTLLDRVIRFFSVR